MEKCLQEKIRNIIESGLKRWNIPSAGYGIVKDGKVFLAGGYGLRDVENGLPADSDTVYMIGSCTKAFTSAIVARLVDEGKLAWDTPVREYLPELRFYDDYTTENATLRDLLCHRLGMPRHEWSWYRTAFTRWEMLHNLRYLEPNAPFRTVCQYFNQGYLVSGCIIERVTGKSYEEIEALCAATEVPEEQGLIYTVLRLPKEQRVAVHLYYYEELSVREIANLLHITENAVKKRLSRARETLRKLLKEEPSNEP